MKMRNLTGAVRKTEGPVFVHLKTSSGVLHVPLQKTGLLTALKDLPLDAQDETEMSIDAAGVLTFVPASPRVCVSTSAPTLEQIDVEDRDCWLQVGQALHHEYQGGANGFERWCDWSRQSSKFDIQDQRRVWQSFREQRRKPAVAILDDDLAGLLG